MIPSSISRGHNINMARCAGLSKQGAAEAIHGRVATRTVDRHAAGSFSHGADDAGDGQTHRQIVGSEGPTGRIPARGGGHAVTPRPSPAPSHPHGPKPGGHHDHKPGGHHHEPKPAGKAGHNVSDGPNTGNRRGLSSMGDFYGAEGLDGRFQAGVRQSSTGRFLK